MQEDKLSALVEAMIMLLEERSKGASGAINYMTSGDYTLSTGDAERLGKLKQELDKTIPLLERLK